MRCWIARCFGNLQYGGIAQGVGRALLEGDRSSVVGISTLVVPNGASASTMALTIAGRSADRAGFADPFRAKRDMASDP